MGSPWTPKETKPHTVKDLPAKPGRDVKAAGGKNCPPWACGAGGNHNETLLKATTRRITQVKDLPVKGAKDIIAGKADVATMNNGPENLAMKHLTT